MNKIQKPSIKKYKEFLIYKNYANNTINQYVTYLQDFLESFTDDANHISAKQAEKWLYSKNYTSISQQNGYISAIKIFYKNIRNNQLNTVNLERPRKEKRLPRILDKDHVLSSINKIENLKHKSIIMLGASVGLRVSEVCNLKIKDVDSKRMIINIIQSKGRKDRIVPLSETMLKTLREYYKEYQPKEYLFEGQKKEKYSPTSCNKLVKKYLGEDCHFHLLRHFCASNLMEQDVNISKIQSILGHASPKTVEIYTHVTTKTLSKLPLAI